MENKKTKILVVDDEADIVEMLQYNLNREGFNVSTAYNGPEALEYLKTNRPDLILLDIMLPRIDGFEVCRNIRSNDKFDNVPIILLTARTSEDDEIYGLRIGASDYISKPISINKIIARIDSNLRNYAIIKKNHFNQDEIEIGPLFMSRERYSVILGQKRIDLAKKEFDILHFLVSNPGKVFNREFILSKIWGEGVCVFGRTVDVHLLNIRKKFGEYSGLIETVKGVGYRFKDMTHS